MNVALKGKRCYKDAFKFFSSQLIVTKMQAMQRKLMLTSPRPTPLR